MLGRFCYCSWLGHCLWSLDEDWRLNTFLHPTSCSAVKWWAAPSNSSHSQRMLPRWEDSRRALASPLCSRKGQTDIFIFIFISFCWGEGRFGPLDQPSESLYSPHCHCLLTGRMALSTLTDMSAPNGSEEGEKHPNTPTDLFLRIDFIITLSPPTHTHSLPLQNGQWYPRSQLLCHADKHSKETAFVES